MAGLATAQQQPALTLDSVISAVEQAVKATSSSDAVADAISGKDGAAVEANNANKETANKDSKESSDKRTAAKSSTIVGGAAALGAVIGAAASKDNRAKGALIGAAVGGGLGYLIERMTRGNDDKPAVEQTVSGEKPAPTTGTPANSSAGVVIDKPLLSH